MTQEVDKLQVMWDRQEIEQLLRRYCRAIDRLDVELLRSIYHPDAVDAHGQFEGNAHEFASYMIDYLRRNTTYCFHSVTQSIIDVRGDEAAAESIYIGYERIPGGWNSVSTFFGARYARSAQQAGTLELEHQHKCGGRYIDRLERRQGEWKILKRRITNEWNECAVTTHILDDGNLANYNLPGTRDRSDPVYANLLT
jgi:SnoaL-like protein